MLAAWGLKLLLAGPSGRGNSTAGSSITLVNGPANNDQSLCYVGEDLIKYNYTIPNVSHFSTYVIVFTLTVIND